VVLAETGRRKSVTGETRQEVQRKLGALQRDIEQGLAPGDGRQTVAQYLTGWLETIRPTVGAGAWLRHEEFARLHIIPALGRVALVKLTPQRVQALYAALLASPLDKEQGPGLSGTTVNHLHGSLHKALDAAVRLGLVPRNVTELVDVPRMAEHEIHPLTSEQSRKLLATLKGERLEALYALALATGMRQGELLALHWRDVELEGRGGRGALSVRWNMRHRDQVFTFKQPKTRASRRRISLAPEIVDALRAHRARQLAERLKAGSAWVGEQWDSLVFTTEIGSPLAPDGAVRSTFTRLLRQADVPRIRFHDLRHTCATLALSANVNPKVVSDMLGHSTVAITLDIYSHVLPDMQEDAAATIAAILYRGSERSQRDSGLGEVLSDMLSNGEMGRTGK
jgi:integrase